MTKTETQKKNMCGDMVVPEIGLPPVIIHIFNGFFPLQTILDTPMTMDTSICLAHRAGNCGLFDVHFLEKLQAEAVLPARPWTTSRVMGYVNRFKRLFMACSKTPQGSQSLLSSHGNWNVFG